ncbi:hypothetical protein AB0903_25140 [Streptomyces sp. NPDC048389]|uniref:hypothetical protein n=1 Tax=Streptomyces sp. NPDC048389 TaxID=3154622 RepID=UPI003456CF1C
MSGHLCWTGRESTAGCRDGRPGHRFKVPGAQRIIKRNTRDGIYSILWTKEAAQRLGADLYYPGCLPLERKGNAAASLGE